MNRKKLSLGLALALMLSLFTGALAQSAPTFAVVDLKTEGLTNPVGVDTDHPAFSWKMASEAVGAAQSSYRIAVTDEAGATLWDSGEVKSRASVGIPYEGEPLEPATAYRWRVTVTDATGGAVTSDEAAFTTSLLDDTFASWEGAQWIGSPTLPLDAPSKAVFRISADVTLGAGADAASFILGAEDYRLTHEVFNPKRLSGENYVRVELDLSGLTASGGGRINVYRVGYDPADDPQVPFATLEGVEALDQVLTEENKYEPHHVDIFLTASTLFFTLDGVELNPTGTVVAEMGNTYPNLNRVGYALAPGQAATFTNYKIENAGRFARGTLYEGEDVTIEGGEAGVIQTFDPSHGTMPYLRRVFDVSATVDRATLYVTAQGVYRLDINGTAIDPESWFNPGFAEYDAIQPYNIYDVTGALQAGENTLSAVLGEGWWTGMATYECLNNNYFGDQPALMARLVMELSDGTTQTLITDEQWEVGQGPVISASLFQGERYDATAQVGDWVSAAVIPTRKQFSSPRLVVRHDAPVHVIKELTARECLGETRPGSGSYIYDMGENLVGVPVIHLTADQAKPGETLILRYAEILYPELSEYLDQGVEGMLMVENLRSALATDFYTMAEGDQTFCPELTFHGYRYIEVTGLDEPLPPEAVGMKVLSSLDPTATYESSNELTNRLFQNIVNSTTGNYLSIPTDCPQRDERMGWTGDAQVYALSAAYVADTYTFMRQWMDTVRADCGETGMSSQYCPAFVTYDPDQDEAVPHKGQSFGITWNCLVVTIPYNLYLQTGDVAILQDNIDNIRAYVDHLIDTPLTYKDADKQKHEEPRLTGETGTLCDHLARVPSDGVSLGNAVFIACLDEAAMMCEALGEADAAAAYRQRAAEAREAWNELFIDAATGKTVSAKGVIQDTQASYATPIRFGVISEENLPRALEHYLAAIENPEVTDSDGLEVPPYTITTGFNATGNVLNALCDHGQAEVAYRLFESTDYASWLYPVTQGATSIWERWNGYTNELGFNGNNSMNSFNHYSFGAVCEWMMAYQLGIQADVEAPGYGHFILQPTPGGDFDYAGGSFESPYGTIESRWTAQGGQLTGYEATVPANTTATLYLPWVGQIDAPPEVTVAGTVTHHATDTTQIELPAGHWRFVQDGDVMRIGANEEELGIRN